MNEPEVSVSYMKRMDLGSKATKIETLAGEETGEIRGELRKWNTIFAAFAILAAICFITAFLICPSENPIACLATLLLGLLFTACAGMIVYSRIIKLKWKLEQHPEGLS